MKKLELKFGHVKEMLTKEQMKKINGGGSYACYSLNDDGTQSTYSLPVSADNACEAQGVCDALAYSDLYTDNYPGGGNVPNSGHC